MYNTTLVAATWIIPTVVVSSVPLLDMMYPILDMSWISIMDKHCFFILA